MNIVENKKKTQRLSHNVYTYVIKLQNNANLENELCNIYRNYIQINTNRRPNDTLERIKSCNYELQKLTENEYKFTIYVDHYSVVVYKYDLLRDILRTNLNDKTITIQLDKNKKSTKMPESIQEIDEKSTEMSKIKHVDAKPVEKLQFVTDVKEKPRKKHVKTLTRQESSQETKQEIVAKQETEKIIVNKVPVVSSSLKNDRKYAFKLRFL
jgi:hypothetical protein